MRKGQSTLVHPNDNLCSPRLIVIVSFQRASTLVTVIMMHTTSQMCHAD